MKVYLGIGSNLGNREKNIEDAVSLIANAEGILLLSRAGIFESAPVGPDQPRFLNTAVALDTDLEFPALLRLCKAVEKKIGRVPTYRWGPRIVDVDILAAEHAAFDSPDLQVPHAELCNRRFALEPLAELCPDLNPDPRRRPVRPVSELLSNVLDQDVRRIHSAPSMQPLQPQTDVPVPGA